jgi:hypothetical protein
MGFDKNYPNRKDIRKPYTGSKAFDCSCRNHGRCGWCLGNRKHFDTAARVAADAKLKDFHKGTDYTYEDEYYDFWEYNECD